MYEVIITIILFISDAIFGGNPGPLQPQTRIVGGRDSSIEQHPFQMALIIKAHNKSTICIASLLTDRVAVTAAHCIPTEKDAIDSLRVRAGSTSRNSGGQVVEVSKYMTHEKFDRSTLNYDVAVLFLEEPIKKEYAKTIRMADNSTEVEIGDEGIIAGWGRIDESIAKLPVFLKESDVVIVDKEQCAKAYVKISDVMLCVASQTDGEGACKGDSGSPLVVNGTLIGMLSGSFVCASNDFPVIFSNLPVLGDWVRDVLDYENVTLSE